jgi:hypothetical protein
MSYQDLVSEAIALNDMQRAARAARMLARRGGVESQTEYRQMVLLGVRGSAACAELAIPGAHIRADPALIDLLVTIRPEARDMETLFDEPGRALLSVRYLWVWNAAWELMGPYLETTREEYENVLTLMDPVLITWLARCGARPPILRALRQGMGEAATVNALTDWGNFPTWFFDSDEEYADAVASIEQDGPWESEPLDPWIEQQLNLITDKHFIPQDLARYGYPEILVAYTGDLDCLRTAATAMVGEVWWRR